MTQSVLVSCIVQAGSLVSSPHCGKNGGKDRFTTKTAMGVKRNGETASAPVGPCRRVSGEGEGEAVSVSRRRWPVPVGARIRREDVAVPLPARRQAADGDLR